MKTNVLASVLVLLSAFFAVRAASPQSDAGDGTQPGSAGSATVGRASAYLTNVACMPGPSGTWTVRFEIQGGDKDLTYGVFRTLNLSGPGSAWEWMGAASSGETNTLDQQWADAGFYVLAEVPNSPGPDCLSGGVAYWTEPDPVEEGGLAVQAGSITEYLALQASRVAARFPAPRTLPSSTNAIDFGELPVSWLVRHFGPDWRNDPRAAANADAYGDGVSNYRAFLQGRNPRAKVVADTGDRARLRVYTVLK